MDTEIQLLRIPEVARVLALSRVKIYDLMNSGQLPSVRIDNARRVHTEDLERFIADRRRQGGPKEVAR